MKIKVIYKIKRNRPFLFALVQKEGNTSHKTWSVQNFEPFNKNFTL